MASPNSTNSPPRSKSSKRASINTTGVLDYLQAALPRKTLLSLYIEEGRGQFVCRAVLQQLTETAQQIVIRLSCTGGTFMMNDILVWTSYPYKKQIAILKELHKWAIIQDYDPNKTGEKISLTIPFAKGLKDSMSSLDSSPWVPLQPQQIEMLQENAKEKPRPMPTSEDLERHTQNQWDSVLHFLVGTNGHDDPPAAVVHLLLQTGLMQPDPDHRGDKDSAPLVITTRGYDFMLQDNHQQVWHFVVQYLRSIEAHEKGEELLKEALLLLISLSFARVGSAYLGSSLKKHCRTMVKDLAHFGLLYTKKIGKTTIFFPTRVAMQMVGSASSDTIANSAASTLWSLSSKALETALAQPNPVGSSHLAIIVQTNFQLAAYTTSEVHISMVGLFCDVGTIRRLPNCVFMQITRDSVKRAFSLGIKARQILRFLEKHTHPKLRNNTFDSPVPSNVVDQIWLWDRELGRVTFTKVYQHQCVMGADEFRAVHQYALERGAHAWSSERDQKLLLDYKHVERMQAFVRQWRAQFVARQNE